MELYTLQITVENQKLTFSDNQPEIFSGDQSIDYVQFTFDDSKWDGFTDIWAVFNRYRGRSYQVELENGKAKIPAEVMINGGHIFIGLLGTDGENVQTSSVLEYSIGQGATNSDLIAPSESIYEQFLSDLDAYQTAVSELASIESRLTTAETTVSNLEPRVTAVDTTVSNMEDTVDGLVSDVSGMRTTVDGLQTDVTALQTSVTALESAVPTLQRDVSALQTGVTNLESRLTAISTSVGSLEDRLATVQTGLTDLEDGLTDAEGRLTTIGNQITDAQTDIEEIETAIAQNNIVTDVTGGGVSFVNNHIADLSFMTVTDTATGSIATFPDGSGLNAVATEIQIEPKQAGSGTPSPDNVREISGFSAVEVETVEKNLLDKSTGVFLADNAIFGGTIQALDGSLILDAGSYTFSVSTTQNGLYVDTASGQIAVAYNNTKVSFTLSEKQAIRLRTYKSVGDASIIEGYNYQLEAGTTATTYEPYNGIQTTINLGQTVYGATIYPEEGRGVIDRSMVDLGTLTWMKVGTSSYPICRASLSDAKDGVGTGGMRNAISNTYPMASSGGAIYNGSEDKVFIINSSYLGSNGFVYVRDSAYDNATTTEFKTAMNGVQLCYELATPIEFTFPAVNIPTLNGTNNIWADSGDIEVEYIANLKKYIEKRLSE